jgi:hypothetical protein
MRIIVLLALVLAVVALIGAGCGGYGNSKTTPGGGTTTSGGNGY